MSKNNRKLQRLSKWAESEFSADSVPTLKTLRKWFNMGKIDGELIDGQYFVYEDFHLGNSETVASKVSELLELSI